MVDLPELSHSTKRKLALRWRSVLEKHSLTGEHLHGQERKRDRRLRIAATFGNGRAWPPGEYEPDEVSIYHSVQVAEGRFDDLAPEYWRLWCSSSEGYEVFVDWLNIFKGQVSADVASVWAGGAKSTERWYEEACGPKVEKALDNKVTEWRKQAREHELRRLDRGTDAKRADGERRGRDLTPEESARFGMPKGITYLPRGDRGFGAIFPAVRRSRSTYEYGEWGGSN